ncbi:cytosolic phospholipase A2 zeta-like [Protopterus annectens]|uniref:cytosolic phospholipase A2 zeta-like n=1 Tax=Protopterus annectens TaxID=7888 RepID=UPI001CF93781|nr:cytosolic phospholipase A2 zeta-like [Protopterus annectens]
MSATGFFGQLSSRTCPIFVADDDASEDINREESWRASSVQKEVHPCRDLTVRIIGAKNIEGADLLSKADCYVVLRLPTASSSPLQTKTIWNDSNPVWNETFQYRIDSAVKNVLELSLYDKDTLLPSDHLSTVMFDIDKLKPGKNTRTFPLNQKGSEQLDVEFEVKESNEPPGEVYSNGVIVTRQCVFVEGRFKKEHTFQWLNANEEYRVTVEGAYQDGLSTPAEDAARSDSSENFCFYMDPKLQTKMEVTVEEFWKVLKDYIKPETEEQDSDSASASVPLQDLPIGVEMKLEFPIGKGLPVYLKATELSGDLDVRLGFDLSKQEKEFLNKRRDVVAQAMKKALSLNIEPEEVPVVAVVGSGGGTRAMTSLYGSLSGLQDLNLLDSVTYMCGVSGSTWCMSTLYEDAKWSCKQLQDAINYAQENVVSSKAAAFSTERLKYYFHELREKQKMGKCVTFTDLWGLILEYILHGKENPAKLSHQQEAVQWGQNPYPIYASVNVKSDMDAKDFAEWCECTPHEVGFPKYGAFVPAEDFGSRFFMGRLIKRYPEFRIPFLEGIWSSAFAVNLDEIWQELSDSDTSWINTLEDATKVTADNLNLGLLESLELQTRLITPTTAFSLALEKLFKSRLTASENLNFLQGLYLHRKYKRNSDFVSWRDTNMDAFPNQLTPSASCLHLVDGAIAINSAFPLVLRPERKVDIILSFDYSWENPFKGLQLTEQYCAERKINFPKIDLSNVDVEHDLKECYMFVDEENPHVPIVLHFPLVNDTFREFKSPGLKRQSPEEKSYGDFNIYTKDSPYKTLRFTYTPEDFNRLVDVNHYNVCNNKETILKAYRLAMTRKQEQKK